MGDVKLIGTTKSPFSARVEWALRLKGVKYEFLEEDLQLQNKSPLLLKYNPVHKKVPVLVHGDKPIAESLIILEYIDETWKNNPLMPEDPFERATARFWAKFVDEKIVSGAFKACLVEGYEEKVKAIETIQESLAYLEKNIQGKKFFSGEQIGFADLNAGGIPLWLGVMEEVGEMKLLDNEKFPSLCEWARNFVEIPLIKECLPQREKLVDYIHARVAYFRSLFKNN